MNHPTASNAIIDHLTAPTLLGASTEERSRHFARWRQARAPLHPTDERLLVAYLLDHEHWAYTTAINAVKAIDAYYRHTVGSALSGPEVRDYLERRKHGAHAPLELVPPLRLEEAHDIAERTEALLDPLAAALQAGLVLLRSFADLTRPLDECWTIVHDVSITTDPTGSHLSLLDIHVPLERAAVAQWHEHLDHLTDRKRAGARVRVAAMLAEIDVSAPALSLTDDQWDSLWHALGVSTYVQLRDRAYMLVGLHAARRHAELARLELTDIHANPRGFTVRFRDGKRKADLVYELAHLTDADGLCPPDCSACALADLLAYVRNVQHRGDGPAFATRYAGKFRAMTRQNARLRIQQLAGERYSTRSLRAGAATSAWERGMSVSDIAATVTGHATLAEAAKYIRKTGAPAGTLQLKIGYAMD